MRRALATLTALALAALLALALAVATGTARLYVVASAAMQPALRCGARASGCEGGRADRVLALARFVSYERGDVVVFDPPPAARAACGLASAFVKRIVGLPGELLELRGEGGRERVYVDGRALPEPYALPQRAGPGERAFRVPAGHVFVLGDNRPAACDSRRFGPVSRERLRGQVVAVVWPPERIGFR